MQIRLRTVTQIAIYAKKNLEIKLIFGFHVPTKIENEHEKIGNLSIEDINFYVFLY